MDEWIKDKENHNLSQLSIEEDFSSSSSSSSMDSWADIDTATVVSIGSSCVILISGCIAVVCLIVYMKKSEQQMRGFSQRPHAISVCGKCGATIQTTIQSINSLSNVSLNKRSIGVLTETTNTTNDDNQRRQSSERQPLPLQTNNESALYAISGANFESKVGEDSLLGIICGHISDTQTTTYSTNCNDIHLKPNERRLHCYSQCSSAQDSELIYELSRDRCPQKLSFESFEVYESIGSEREDTPTDPGIRQFTESPPKPNERRQGVVQHVTNDSNSTTPTNESFEQNFGAIPRYRSRQPMWKLSSESQTIKCLSSLTTTDFEVNGLSSGDSDDGDDDDEDVDDNHFMPPIKSIDC